MDTQKFLEIAQALDRKDWCKRIANLSARSAETTPIYLPLIGEFSSGKTTLINALTDSKCLETATKPTTATIYKVFFGQEENKAEVVNSSIENLVEQIDLEDLKNDTLKNSLVVNLYDTSRKVPQNIVLIDTPGLSSPDVKHKQTLVDFLPQADAILLVTDINQQLTKSLIEFVSTISETGRPIYLIVTKSDTKSPEDIRNLRSEILDNGRISVEDVIFVSAQTNNLSELDELLQKIKAQQKDILEKSNAYQLKLLAEEMISYIDRLQQESVEGKNPYEAIDMESNELKKVQRYIKQLEEHIESDLKDINRETERFFEKKVTQSMNKILSSKNIDYNSAVNEAINIDSRVAFNQYKSKLQNLIQAKASETKLHEFGINLEALTNEDWEEITLDTFSIETDLNSVGHEYDKAIGWATIVGAAIAVTALTVATAGTATAAAGTAVAGAGTTAATAGTVAAGAGTAGKIVSGVASLNTAADIIDTASDIASIRSNQKLLKQQRLQKYVTIASNVNEKSQEINRQVGGSKGPLSGIVSAGTEKLLGRPQRNRIIQGHLDSQLLPEFRLSLQNISSTIVRGVSSHIATASRAFISSKKELIKKLLDDTKENEEKKRLLKKQLNDYRTELTKTL